MKSLLSILFVLTFSSMLNCQVYIQWQKCLGGSSHESANSIQQTTDGGYVLAGSTGSNNGDVSGNHGGNDMWVVKLDNLGIIQWQKCLGGTANDGANSIQVTSEGGYIVAGYTSSNDGDVSGNNGGSDMWVVKLDNLGNIQWQKCLGGTSLDEARSIQSTTDGGYIVAGSTYSNDCDVSGNNGSTDMWVVKLDNFGNILWQNSLGGTDTEIAFSIKQTIDGGYILAGQTNSDDGDVSGYHGYPGDCSDFWLTKLDVDGNIVWQKCLGGEACCEIAYSVFQTIDGEYLVAGYANSNDGDVSGNHGFINPDAWLVKLDISGNIIWQKCLGGVDNDYAYSVQQTSESGFIISGGSNSVDGDLTEFFGGNDIWVVKIDNTGNIQWQKSIGGTANDYAKFVIQISDGGYVFVGSTESNDGQITGNHGGLDVFLVKLNYPNIEGTMFFDENENQIKDIDEVVVSNQMVKLEPGPQFIFTNNDGNYFFVAEPGNYTVSYVPQPYWFSTTDDYVFSIDSIGHIVDSIDIGVFTRENIHDVAVYLTGSPTRAGFDTHYWLTYKNWGTVNASGNVSFEYDPLLTYVSSTVTPSSIIGNILEFDYENLGPGVHNTIRTDFVVPGVEYLGDTLISSAFITPFDPDTCLINNYDTLRQVITAAYDPNDKNVSPAGIGTPGYVLHGERLTYTIRFQNTGNDTAFTVVIRDTINNNLDNESLRIEAYSHPVTLQLHTSNELFFYFENILLPDSTVNEPESHGFVRYSISPKPGLADGTLVTNTSYIFFDYNPAIVTNTTFNTFVSEIPVSIPEQKLTQIFTYPNPSKDIVYINLPELTHKIEVYNINGEKVLQQVPNRQVAEINISSLSNGIYLVKIYCSSGVINSRFVKN